MLRSEAKLQTCKTADEQANRAFTEPWPSGGVTVTPRQRGARFQLSGDGGIEPLLAVVDRPHRCGEGRISLARTSSRGRNGASAPGGDEGPHTEGKVDHRQDRRGGLGEDRLRTFGGAVESRGQFQQ